MLRRLPNRKANTQARGIRAITSTVGIRKSGDSLEIQIRTKTNSSRAFNDRSQMTVYFFLRQSDNRTRIVCKVPHRSRPSETFCFPLNLLEVTRSGSSLHLCRRRHAGSELVIWATLNFMTIESKSTFPVLVYVRMTLIVNFEFRLSCILLHLRSSSCSGYSAGGDRHSRL